MDSQLVDVTQICRTCLKVDSNMRNIFLFSLEEMFQDITSLIIVKNDGFPGQICESCFNRITDAFSFKDLCLNSNEQLKNILKNTVKTERLDEYEVPNCLNSSVDKIEDTNEEKRKIDAYYDGIIVNKIKEESIDHNLNDGTHETLNVSEDVPCVKEELMSEDDIEIEHNFNKISDSDDSLSEIPKTEPNELERVKLPPLELLQMKSQNRYEIAYKEFMNSTKQNNLESLSEIVLLAYFGNLSKKIKPNSLWVHYSMLKSTLILHHNVNISQYTGLKTFLTRQNIGYRLTNCQTLTSEQIEKFVKEAPDEKYLFTKVALIFGITGACRKKELAALMMNDIEESNSSVLVHIRNSKTKQARSFTLNGSFYECYKKYVILRPQNIIKQRFFLNYQNGKCTRKPVGINKFGLVPKEVATYLRLPNPKLYTGHCFWRSNLLLHPDEDIATSR